MKKFLILALVYFIACSTDVETCQDKSVTPVVAEDCFERLTEVGENCCFIQVLAEGVDRQSMCYDYDKSIRVEEIVQVLSDTYSREGHILENVVCPADQHAGYLKAGLLLLAAFLL